MTEKKVKLNLVGLDGNAFSLPGDAKVGDWVDCKDPVGVHAQCKVLEILEHNVIVECKTGHRWSLPHNNIIRKLDRSEVKVRITLEGTVSEPVCDGSAFLLWTGSGQHKHACVVQYADLDPITRSLVEGLLKAQEEN